MELEKKGMAVQEKSHLRVAWNTAIALVLVTPLVLYLHALLKYGANVPNKDDYQVVLDFLNRFIQANGFHEKFSLLFRQHWEYRLFFNHIVELAQYAANGRVNFVQLMILGSIGWMLAVYILYTELGSSRLNPAYFIPVMLMMFNLTHWSPMNWAMSSIQNYFGVFFPLASIYVLTKRPGTAGLICSLFLMAASIFTSGTGFVLIPVALMALVSQKRYADFFISSLAASFLLLVFFYFLKYVNPSSAPIYMKNPLHIMLFSLANLGNTFFGPYILYSFAHSPAVLSTPFFFYGFYASVACGLAFIAFFVYLAVKGLYKRNGGFVFWAILLIILISIEIAIGRGSRGLQNAVLIPRYSLYPLLLISLLYLAGLDFLKDKENKKKLKRFGLAFFVFALLFYASTYSPGIWFLNNEHNVLKNRIPDPASQQILMESDMLGIYQPNWMDGNGNTGPGMLPSRDYHGDKRVVK